MSNREVARAFAHGHEAQGSNFRSVRETTRDGGNMLVLYSYGTPVAYQDPHNAQTIFDPRKYSVTTSKQVGYARHEVIGRDAASHAVFRQALKDFGISLAGAR